ncbi:hypothetical protein [Aeromicrobium sp.]|uniref:hypothetical protein n=1 Tax=Aeromicrobium sp. TaxID=1871063 RepID=UPI0030BAC6D0
MTGSSSTADSAATNQVGSVAEEAFKLFRAMAAQPSAGEGVDSAHMCTTTWCPVCQVAGFVRDNPDAIAKVSESATQLARSLRDLIDTALTTPRDNP